MQVTLKVLSGNHEGKLIQIRDAKFLIGRSESCQLRPKSELINRKHCVIIQEVGRVFLLDLKSRNGTFINGKQLSPETAKILKNGDILRCGQLEFEIILEKGLDSAEPKVGSVRDAADFIDASEGLSIDSWLEEAEELPHDDARVIVMDDTAWPEDSATQDSGLNDDDSLIEIAASGNDWKNEFPKILELLKFSHVYYPDHSEDAGASLLEANSIFRKAVTAEFDIVGVFDCRLACKDGQQFDLGIFLEFQVLDSLSSLLGLKLGPEYNQEQISQMLEDFGDKTCLWCFLHAEVLSANDLQRLREFTQSLNRVLFCGPNQVLAKKCETKLKRPIKREPIKLPKQPESLSTKNTKDAATETLRKYFGGR